MKRKTNKNNKPFQARQGDILITETGEKPNGVKQNKGQRPVLAEGEVTGHAHVLDDPAADWWKGDGEQTVLPSTARPVVHQEHGRIPLKARTHKVRRQSQYSPQEIRRVED